MYKDFFGLREKPFSITPDPKFLYMSPGHKEALAHLLYGMKEGSGFVVITGEVGTGKTTILNAFLLKLPPRMPKVVIKNPNIKTENLYFLLGEAIGIPGERRSRDNIHEFENRLKEIGGAVLIVDEAQGLAIEMLEEIRLLSNLETMNEKLVQIMLLGQQELNEKLQSPQLRQLKQRIGIKYHIPPLDNKETRDYIDHRLRIAGYEPKEKPLFTTSALNEIYRYSKGFPRLINIVCDNLLISAFTDEIRQINATMVKRVVSDLEETYGKSKSSGEMGVKRKHPLLRRVIVPAGVFLLLAGGFWMLSTRTDLAIRIPDTFVQVTGAVSQIIGADPQRDSVSPEGPASSPVMSPGVHSVPAKEKISIIEEKGEPSLPPVPPTLVEPEKETMAAIRVHRGDTLAELAAVYYGRVDSGILDAIKQANPSLENIDLIYEGQEIFLPDIETMPRELFSVSVASYHSITEAKAVFLDLLDRGFDATIYPYVDSQKNHWYRITIGTFSNRTEAIQYSEHLGEKGFLYAKPVKIRMEE
ncbi:MAG: AAA family ATPase [Desulfomonilia bacterium]